MFFCNCEEGDEFEILEFYDHGSLRKLFRGCGMRQKSHDLLMAESDNASAQLRVDEAILDYLIFAATSTLIENAKSVLSNDVCSKDEALAEISLELVDCKHTFKLLSRHQHDSH